MFNNDHLSTVTEKSSTGTESYYIVGCYYVYDVSVLQITGFIWSNIGLSVE